ncbi:MAG: hypothetical protein AAF686_03345 [Pseudomonadota bacterium]
MGSFRSGLIVGAILVLAGPADAAVCQDFRPDWNGETVGAWDEMLALLSMPISLILLIATAFAIRFRSPWLALCVFVGWSFAVASVTFFDPTGGIRANAALEGCVGSPSLYIAVVLSLCAGMMIYLNKFADPDTDI